MHDFHRAAFSSLSQQVRSVFPANPSAHPAAMRLAIAIGLALWCAEATFFSQPLFAQTGARTGVAKPGTPKPGASKKKIDKAAPEKSAFEQPDPEWLPPSFQPLPEPPAIMELEQPIATTDELAKLKKDFGSRFTKALREADLSANGKQIITGGLRYRLAEMTLRDKRKLLPDLHKTLMREITTGIGSPNVKQADTDSATQFVYQELLKQVPELLVNNFYVRLHAVLILSELDYAPSYALLLQVIQAKDISEDPVNGQPQAIKIAAMQGLIRILKYAAPPPPVKDRGIMAVAMVSQLENPENHWWFQLRLIEGLRNMTVSIDTANNKPFVIEALLTVMKDPKRVWSVRAKASYAIGRVPVPPVVKPDDLVTAVADCALQLANAAQAKPNNPIWKGCFWDLYLAFKPDGPKDLDAERKVSGGLLTRFRPVAQPAYDVIVPICSGVIQGKAPDPGDVLKLGGFVRARLAMNEGAKQIVPVNNQVPDKAKDLPKSDPPAKGNTANNSGTSPNSSAPAALINNNK